VIVAKVGGSLYDLDDLGPRLWGWLCETDGPVVLVAGGGPTADLVRGLDRRHRLGDAVAHDLALRAMTLNAHFLAAVLGAAGAGPVPVCDPPAGRLALLDAHAFWLRDRALPESWDATSDALAARAAAVLEADELVLLKSVSLPEPVDWDAAARAGHVDLLFSGLARALPRVRVVNLRAGSA
jgi:aspartokinase-like uncharacterized kinase